MVLICILSQGFYNVTTHMVSSLKHKFVQCIAESFATTLNNEWFVNQVPSTIVQSRLFIPNLTHASYSVKMLRRPIPHVIILFICVGVSEDWIITLLILRNLDISRRSMTLKLVWYIGYWTFTCTANINVMFNI